MTREIYEKSINILLDSYNSGTLFHGSCDTCAVSQLLGGEATWGIQFCTMEGKQESSLSVSFFMAEYGEAIPKTLHKANRREIYNYLAELYKSRGYAQKELMQIEYAFELAIWDKELANKSEEAAYCKYEELKNSKKGQYLGLKAVLEVMEHMVEEPIESEGSMQKLQKIAYEKYHVAI